MQRFSLLAILLLFLSTGCNRPEEDNKDIVVRIGDELLTKSDLNTLLLENRITSKDSAILIKNFVKNWIVNQILSQKAEKNLNDIDLNKIENMVDDYRTTLFVQQYKQRYINQKLNTDVSDQDLIAFYQTFNFDFHLKTTIVKAFMITMPATTNKYYKIRNLLNHNLDKNYPEIEKISTKNQFNINNFNQLWINFEPLKNEFNINDNNLKTKDLFSKKDSAAATVSLLKIIDFKLSGDTIPLQLVKDDLKKIILHKRKQNIIYKLEHNAYEDVLENKDYFVAKPYIIKDEN